MMVKKGAKKSKKCKQTAVFVYLVNTIIFLTLDESCKLQQVFKKVKVFYGYGWKSFAKEGILNFNPFGEHLAESQISVSFKSNVESWQVKQDFTCQSVITNTVF